MPPSRATRKRANAEDSPAPLKRIRGQKGDGRGRGRAATTPKPEASSSKKKGLAPRRPTLFDDLDGVSASPSPAKGHPERQHLEELDEDEDDSSLTSLTDQEFEDVLVETKAESLSAAEAGWEGEDSSSDEEEDIEFEDVAAPVAPFPLLSLSEDQGQEPSGDLELTLHKDTRVSLTNPYGEKKGPSKVERLVRNATHCVHVQALLWHNSIRNAWICDPEVQGILLSHLPTQMWDEVDRWRRASGLEKPVKDAGNEMKKNKKKAGGAQTKKGKQPASASVGAATARSTRRGEDWGSAAQRLEEGTVDMSHGDPLFRLMRALSAWWRQKFRTTAPGLRKMGYVSLERLDRMMKEYQEVAGLSSTRHGELIPSLAVFRIRAQKLCSSRDVGAQLFTALLRGLGLEARMVASLQPLGFGWNKMEDADPEVESEPSGHIAETVPLLSNSVTTSKRPQASSAPDTSGKTGRAAKKRQQPAPRRGATRQGNSKANPAVIDSDSGPGLDSDQDLELPEVNSDNDSAVVVPELKTGGPQSRRPVYDKDLEFPHYWTEVLSPVTQKYLPVDALVKRVIATNRELVESLEPRGVKADKARQVTAYVVGFSADGTAKDVTVRYLKRQVLPGRTKGARFPVEKLPVYDKHGKVKRHDLVDWFRLVMRSYGRGQRQEYPITEADEEEDATDLRPAKAEKKEVKEGEETLQYYKQSKEFVLERHLKREEALVEGAEPVKVFRNSKSKAGKAGKDGKAEEENVFLRKDVVGVKSAETWHKQGRAPRAGAQPLKRVPYRAATTNRRREIAEAEAATGERVLQGLYSLEQTDWIIPAPIRDGVIPKNEYGNIDLFVEHMCPRGAVHVPYRGAARVCRRLEVDYAEAVVDFEFGHRMAVPVIQGVVVAEEQHERVLAELARDEAERKRREDDKRRAAALSQWRKMLMGLRIVERIRQDYGEVREDERVFGSGHHEVDLGGKRGENGESGNDAPAGVPAGIPADDPDMAGGFLPEGFDYEEEEPRANNTSSSFFPVHDEEAEDGEMQDGELVVEGDELPLEDELAVRPVRPEAAAASGGGGDIEAEFITP